MQKAGLVQKRVVARGSKSERSAVVLVAPDGEFILRRSNPRSFADPELESLVGRHVTVEGVVLPGRTFQADSITPTENPPAKDHPAGPSTPSSTTDASDAST